MPPLLDKTASEAVLVDYLTHLAKGEVEAAIRLWTVESQRLIHKRNASIPLSESAKNTIAQNANVSFRLISRIVYGEYIIIEIHDHVYRVDVRNAGKAVADLNGSIASRLRSIGAIDAVAGFGAVGAHQIKASTDTITLRAGKYFDRRLDPKKKKAGRWQYDDEGRDDDDGQVPGLRLDIDDWRDEVVDLFYDIKFQFLFSWAFTIGTDRAAPVIAQALPQGAIDGAKPTIGASYQDNLGGTGIDVNKIILQLDGTDVTAKAKKSATGISFKPTTELAQGPHKVTLSVADKANNSATATWSFIVDTIEPVVFAQSPPNKAGNASPSVSISAHYADHIDKGGSGIDTGNIVLRVDHVDVTALATRTGSAISYTPAKKLADGKHQVSLKVPDSAGNVATSDWSFGVDGKGVTIAGQTPADGAVLAADAVPTIGAVFVSVGTVIDPAKTSLLIDGKNVSAQSTIGTGGVSYKPPAALAEGMHNVTLSAPDKRGNLSEASWNFATRSPPEIGAVAPKDVVLNAQSVAAISAQYRDTGAGIEPAGLRPGALPFFLGWLWA